MREWRFDYSQSASRVEYMTGSATVTYTEQDIREELGLEDDEEITEEHLRGIANGDSAIEQAQNDMDFQGDGEYGDMDYPDGVECQGWEPRGARAPQSAPVESVTRAGGWHINTSLRAPAFQHDPECLCSDCRQNRDWASRPKPVTETRGVTVAYVMAEEAAQRRNT